MQIIFTELAVRDIADLRAYLEPMSLSGLRHVMLRLETVISMLPANPHIGRPTPRDGVRELVEPKYGFLIPYTVHGGKLYILRLYRSKRQPLDYGGLTMP